MILINSSPKNALKIFQPFLSISMPVGIGFLVAALEKENITAYIVDEQVEDDSIGLIQEYVNKIDKPYIFGFSVLTATYKSAIILSKKLKEFYPDSIIIFGGIHPTALPDEVLSNNHIDFVIRGEGEKALPELYRSIKNGGDFSKIKNLSYKENGQAIHNERASIIDDLDAYPKFPYHLFRNKKYDLGFILSSRGCPYDCIFCSNRITTGKKYRYRSADVIADELLMIYQNYGKKNVGFYDDNFLVNKKRIYSLIEAIAKKGLDKKMTFEFQARADNVDYQVLKDLYSSGFRGIFFGIESASNELLKTLKKGETIEQIVNAVKIAKEIGYYVNATFIFAIPGETHKDRMDCVRLSKELNLDMVRFNNATPYPGTELYNMATLEGSIKILGLYENLNSVSIFIENPFMPVPLSYVPKGCNEGDIRDDILLSYFLFYFNFNKLKHVFGNPDKSSGWFNAGASFISIFKKMPAFVMLSFWLSIKFGKLFLNLTKKFVTQSHSKLRSDVFAQK